jgi:DNA repair exonuclease SbcCD ATPase subunit
MNLQVDSKIKESSSSIGASKNNVENLTEKLNSIRETDRIYKKYSVYLQAVGRDGIPAMIIKKKLPIINHKINNLLKSMVAFKVEMNINAKGDVKEVFYFSENKMDTLPIGSGSGSVKFIASTAISDALHYVSSLIKPSLKVIDEGFDTLDNRKLTELNMMFNYLRAKYKNIFIVTHKSEVRDYVDNIIEVEKTKDGIIDPEVLANPEAGISKFVYS